VRVIIHPIWRTKYWWQKLTYPRRKVPLTEVGETQEQNFPWRLGKCRVFRLPLTRHAIAIGQWTGEQPHENVEGAPTLMFRPLDHPEDYFHVEDVQEEPH
jgi:hypothetical protein